MIRDFLQQELMLLIPAGFTKRESISISGNIKRTIHKNSKMGPHCHYSMSGYNKHHRDRLTNAPPGPEPYPR